MTTVTTKTATTAVTAEPARTTRIAAAYVIGFDGTDHVVHRDAEVVYRGARIVHVGTGFSGPVDEHVDLGQAVICPGFIDLDALADIDHALLDSWSPAGHARGFLWSEDWFRHGRQDVFTADERRFIREYAVVQLLLNGVTTLMPIASEVHSGWAESYDDLMAMAEICRRLGARAYLGPSFRSGVNVVRADGSRDVLWDEALGEHGLAEAIRFVRDADALPGGLIRGALLPCRIETLTEDLLRALARAAGELGCPVRLHCGQSGTEVDLLRRWYGRTPLELLTDVGLLGPQLLVPHAMHLGGLRGGDDPARVPRELAAHGVSVVHCPLTSLRYGAALESFDRFRSAGVTVALGSDSFPPDLIRGMDYGSNVAKFVDGRLDAGSAADYFRALTLGGARALGRVDLGRLAPGAFADLTAVRLDALRTGVVDDPVRTMLMNASGADVTMSVVAGRTVVRDGAVPGIDVPAMRAEAQRLFGRMKSAYAARDFLRRPAGELFPPSFPLAPDPEAE